MDAQQIRTAIDAGKTVYWHHEGYQVIKDSIGQYLIKCHMNDNYTGLTHKDGITLNGDPDAFYIEPS
tara:strand:- start:35 stop:235 length:201 start_codon:yes stop_codon:yes gene_type:complete